MTSEEFAQEVARAVLAVQSRILGIGRSQYERDGRQQFEDMSPAQIVQFGMEEAEDLVAYATMLRIRLNEIKKAMELLDQPPKGRHAAPDNFDWFTKEGM